MKPIEIYGLHSVKAVLEREPQRALHIWTQQGRDDARMSQILELAARFGVHVDAVPKAKLDQRSEGQHQGIIALIKPAPEWQEQDLLDWVASGKRIPFLLILDGVTDPHNLGACLRSADAAGVDAIVMPRDKSAALTPAARKVASGAAETVPVVRVTNLARAMKSLRDIGVWMVGTAGEASGTLYQSDLRGPLAVVMGAEGKGMRRLTREHCDVLVNLPMAGTVSSLNVSVACGVVLFEALRQRSL
ncbi:MAG: 23S rRNA (guanosine(2251)-2'-O)-methyltransferase RlmB [Alteromonadaceae bacterium]|nr:23S rRNA (guanosine(2251)-2'-O)-methyltransferase RlmB [Alteromonadaceae bacterium]